MSVDSISAERRAWLEARRSQLGASEVATILGLNKFATPWEVWAEKTGRLSPDSGTAATAAGVTLEPAVLSFAEQQLGPLTRDYRVPHRDLPLAATCDAIVQDTERPVEAKTTGIVGPVSGSWGDALTDEVPEQYLIQVQAQLMCTEADLGYLFALIPGRGFVEYHIEPNIKLHSYLADKIGSWWDLHITQDVEPSINQLPDIEVVKRLKRTEGKAIEADLELHGLIIRRESLKEQRAEVDRWTKETETKILLALGDADRIQLSDGTELHYAEQTRRAYSVAAATFRSFRIRKNKRDG